TKPEPKAAAVATTAKPAEPTITLVDKDTKETKVVAADTKIVFPDDSKRFKHGVLEVWFPNRNIVDVTAATKKAIAQLNHTETNTSMQGSYEGGSIIFGLAPDGTKYTSTMAAGGNYTLVRIHYGDWGNLEESTKIAYKISDNL
ncbi:MAG: hypothetical protein LBV12_11315, partial [Puniceicoccales bacterium]|nr:hypothetical protein [Puniceicoccales bacterium]